MVRTSHSGRLDWPWVAGFGATLLALVLALEGSASAKPLDACDRDCGYALVQCLLDEGVGGRSTRRQYRLCRRQILGACRAQGTDFCVPPPTTTTTTLPAVPPVSLSGRWVLDLDLLEVFGCTSPSMFASVVADVSQDGDALTATLRGYGGHLSGYRGQVTNAGFDLAISYTRRIQGRRCHADVRLSGFGFDTSTEIPVFVSASATCGRSYCGGTFVGTMTPESSEGE